jgi:hypothetical protein
LRRVERLFKFFEIKNKSANLIYVEISQILKEYLPELTSAAELIGKISCQSM